MALAVAPLAHRCPATALFSAPASAYRVGMTLNILITGTSRGIGEAILAAFENQRAIGHSTRGGDGRIAADLSVPGAAANLEVILIVDQLGQAIPRDWVIFHEKNFCFGR